MQFTHRSPIVSSALKTLTAAVASAVFLSSAAHAAGLGKLTVLSALGQPLRAEIELTAVSNDEAAGLVAKLASPDAFRVANIEFNPALMSLRFSVEQRNGRQYIKISSSQPLNEPFVDLLLELSWNSGRLVREYTFLLDPAELRATQSAQVAVAAAAAPPAQSTRAEAQGSRASAPAAPAAVAQAEPKARPQRPARGAEQAGAGEASAQAGASQYRVRRGDTLGRIAGQLKPVDISLDMMLVALYRANPDAFIGNNMNRLKSGQILSVPDSDALRGSGDGEAHGVVVAHAADFNAYRNKLAGQVATSAPVKAPSAGQSAAGKVSAKVEERPTAANESQDQLRLSKAVPTAGAGGKGTTTASTEETIAKEKALADAQARVKELERNVNDLEKLMTVKTKTGTEAVKNATQDNAPAAPAPARPVVAAAPKKAAPPPEPGFADMLMDNINYVGAGAAVLLLALFGISRRKKNDVKLKRTPAEPSILGVPNQPGHSLFAETGGQSVDTNNSVFNSSFAPSASQLDTNEVDPVAEADVYIAYGRDAQAEEILKEALRSHPERAPVRLKLLEIYAARKDQRAFETQAAELYSLTRGQGDEWAQASALGLSIDPLNPLYANGAGITAAAPAATGQQAMLAQQLEQAFSAGRNPGQASLGIDLAADNAETALPQAPAQAAAKADEDSVLDFDLGGLDFAPVSASEPIAMTGPAAGEGSASASVPDLEFDMAPFAPAAGAADVPAPATPAVEEESFDLAFDMNFDAPAAPQAAGRDADDELALDLSLGGPVTEIDMADLAREFDLPELPLAPEDSAPATELKDPLFDLDAMDFDLAPAAAPAQSWSAAAAAPEEFTAAPVADKEPLFDLDAMDFGLPASAAAPAGPVAAATAQLDDDPFALPDLPEPQEAAADAAATIPRFDMSGIDLELPQTDEQTDEHNPGPADDPAMAGMEAAGAAGELSAAQMEMETKLDLAIAYQEIGDKEGARELLDEVIKGGSSEQVGKANAMRAKLA